MADVVIVYDESDEGDVSRVKIALRKAGLDVANLPLQSVKTQSLSLDDREMIFDSSVVVLCLGQTSISSHLMQTIESVSEKNGNLVKVFVGRNAKDKFLTGKNLVGWDGDVKDPNWASTLFSVLKKAGKSNVFDSINLTSEESAVIHTLEEDNRRLSNEIVQMRKSELGHSTADVSQRVRIYEICLILLCSVVAALLFKISYGNTSQPNNTAVKPINSVNGLQTYQNDIDAVQTVRSGILNKSDTKEGWPSHEVPDANYSDEKVDWSVVPTESLTDDVARKTPTSMQDAQVVSTANLIELGRDAILITPLGIESVLPGSIEIVGSGNGGKYGDTTEKALGNILYVLTGGNKKTKIIIYCSSSQCWESHNAAIRAKNLGYDNIYWYRGGVESWKSAHLKTRPPIATFYLN